MCVGHAAQAKRGTPLRPLRKRRGQTEQVCDFPDCTRRHASGGLCSGHEAQKRRGYELKPLPIQKKNSKGFGSKTDAGYRVITVSPDDPLLGGKKNRSMLEHRYIMAHHLGRPLLRNENVHHKNGEKADNRLENLELWVKAQPTGVRVSDQIDFAIQALTLYRTELDEDLRWRVLGVLFDDVRTVPNVKIEVGQNF